MKCQNLWDVLALIYCISKEWVIFFVGDNFKSVRYFEAHLKLCIIDEGNCQRREKGGTKLTRHSSQISKVASKIHVRRVRNLFKTIASLGTSDFYLYVKDDGLLSTAD